MTDRIAPFQYLLPSGSRTALSRIPSRGAQTLSNILHGLGGPDLSHVIVQRMPDGVDFWDVDDRPLPMIQAAGSSHVMTIEWGRFDPRGEWIVSTVGRGGERIGSPDEIVTWNEESGSKKVFPDELFDADEAARVFAEFLIDVGTPAKYALRPVDLTSRRTP